VEDTELAKRLFVAAAGAVLALVFLSAEARAEGCSLESGVFFAPGGEAGGSPVDTLYMQDRGYTERTYRRRDAGGYDPQGRTEQTVQFSFRLGWLFVVHALDVYGGGTPADSPLAGAALRFKLPPQYRYIIEVGVDSNAARMRLDETPSKLTKQYPGGITELEDFYQEYFDCTVSFLFLFKLGPGERMPFYAGAGIGYAKETARANYLSSDRGSGYPGAKHVPNESPVIQVKLGWDTGKNLYFEVVYKKLLEVDRNLDQLLNIVLGIYF
jgi:hypothetical protein